MKPSKRKRNERRKLEAMINEKCKVDTRLLQATLKELNYLKRQVEDNLASSVRAKDREFVKNMEWLTLPVIQEMVMAVKLDDIVPNMSCKTLRINVQEAQTIIKNLRLIQALAESYRFGSRVIDRYE